MYEKSPWNVQRPILLGVGLKDVRVPPTQAMEMYRLCLYKGIPVKLQQYPDDGHQLLSHKAQIDILVNTVLWAHEHLPGYGN
jgi:acylaminoacyl-peptidase